MLHKTGRPAEGEGWTDARVAWLKELWAEGHSAGQIANIMGGGVSRSAVIGKVHRLKLSPRSTVVAHPRPHGNKGQPKANAIVQRVAAKKAQAPNLEELPVEPIPEEDGVDVTHLIGIMDLNQHTCRYPHGDPLEAGFGFCGRPVKAESVYCPEHHERCYGVLA